MLTPPLPPGDERRLTRIFRRLDPEARRTLLRFAEFLHRESVGHAPEPGEDASSGERGLVEPEVIPRPVAETVVGAIKRLSLSYPMLDRHHMLDETSKLMAAHVLNGHPARDVIDDLEALFARHYGAYREHFAR